MLRSENYHIPHRGELLAEELADLDRPDRFIGPLQALGFSPRYRRTLLDDDLVLFERLERHAVGVREDVLFNDGQSDVIPAVQFQHGGGDAALSDFRHLFLACLAFRFQPDRFGPPEHVAGSEVRSALNPVRRFRSQLFPNPELRYSSPTVAHGGAHRNEARFRLW